MKKSDLARALTAHNDITLKQAEEIVNLFFAQMTEVLEKGEKVEIRGFGSLSAREYVTCTGRNPRTGEKLEVKLEEASDLSGKPQDPGPSQLGPQKGA